MGKDEEGQGEGDGETEVPAGGGGGRTYGRSRSAEVVKEILRVGEE